MFRFLKKKLFWLLAAVVVIGSLCAAVAGDHHDRRDARGDQNRSYAGQAYNNNQNNHYAQQGSSYRDHGQRAYDQNAPMQRKHHEGGFGWFWLIPLVLFFPLGGLMLVLAVLLFLFFFLRKRLKRARRRTFYAEATPVTVVPQEDFLDKWEQEARRKLEQQRNKEQE